MEAANKGFDTLWAKSSPLKKHQQRGAEAEIPLLLHRRTGVVLASKTQYEGYHHALSVIRSEL
ncbi:hypothetical protein PFUM301597_20990 [Pseudomonas fluorescens]